MLSGPTEIKDIKEISMFADKKYLPVLFISFLCALSGCRLASGDTDESSTVYHIGGYASYTGVTGGDNADTDHTWYLFEFDTTSTYDNDQEGVRNYNVIKIIASDWTNAQNGKYWNSAKQKYESDSSRGKDYYPKKLCIEGNVESTDYTGNDRVLKLSGLKNITIEGVKNGAVFLHYGLQLGSCENVIIRNIHFKTPYKDAIGLENCQGVIVEHCTFSDWAEETSSGTPSSDGAIDIGTGSNGITVAYNHFNETFKTMLYSSGGYSYSDSLTDKNIAVTLEYNWFDKSHSRHPLLRFGVTHVLNNYFDGNTQYGSDVRHGGSLLIEGNYYKDVAKISETSLDVSDIPSWSTTKDYGFEYGYPGLIKLKHNASNYQGEIINPVHHGINGMNRVEAFEVLQIREKGTAAPSDKFVPAGTEAQEWSYTPPYDYVVMDPLEVPDFVQARAGCILKLPRPDNKDYALELVSHGSIHKQ